MTAWVFFKNSFVEGIAARAFIHFGMWHTTRSEKIIVNFVFICEIDDSMCKNKINKHIS